MASVRIRQPRAARAAAVLARELGVEAEIVEGQRGEFSVWVGDQLVAKKDRTGFPSEGEICAAVRRARGGE